jgi:gamma-glutamyltranspeptidase/glutathione hydrolase
MAADTYGSGRLRALVAAAVALSLPLAGCETLNDVKETFVGGPPPAGQLGQVTGFLGGVVADEPRAALIGRDILSAGGSAADAATAVGFALAVTLPSRAGLGGGGACLAYSPGLKSPDKGEPVAVMFVPPAAGSAQGADRPAAVPMLARGLFALQARYGTQQFEALIKPAEELARFGTPASRALVRDIQVVAGPLAADPNARAVFTRNGAPLAEGDPLVQPDLASLLAQIRVSGVGDLYQGALGRRIETATPLAGGPVTLAELRASLPSVVAPISVPQGRDQLAFLPPPADGGLAAAAAVAALDAHPNDVAAANARGLAVAAQWRRSGGDPQALLAASVPPASLPILPASTTFATLDRDGNAVVCALTMNNLFGTGRVAPGMGMLLAASPRTAPPPLLSAALAWNTTLHEFRAEVGGSGQEGAPLAVAFGMLSALRADAPMPVPVPEPGRANVIACSKYLPGAPESCGSATDPRGAGLAAGSN